MSVHEILITLMGVFALFGALDRIFGNRLGLGKEFEKGFHLFGTIALSMIGILVLSGEATMDDVETSDVKPHMIFGKLADMIPYLE